MSTRARRHEAGFNLIELLISIVVISIACTGVLLVYAQTVRFSADPMVQTQALAVAEAYLDEILARPVTDPDGTNAGETRATWDNVGDYNGLSNSPPQDQNGTVADLAPVDGQPDLAGYQVDVAVTANVMVNGVAMSQVDVRVRYVGVVDFTLTGYRAP
ncbi:MAG: type IV pilus modification PilV family protein [Gammaproteobacteria bacterium]